MVCSLWWRSALRGRTPAALTQSGSTKRSPLLLLSRDYDMLQKVYVSSTYAVAIIAKPVAITAKVEGE